MTLVYDLKTGYPTSEIAPLEHLSQIAAAVIASGKGFQYGGSLHGHEEARQGIAAFLSTALNVPCRMENLILTTGALTAIDMVCRTLTQPGDVVIVEDPTFFFAVDLLRMSHCEVVGVPMIDGGLDLERLREVIMAHAGRVKLVYTIPSFQNPTGITSSAAHRAELVQMAETLNFHILEDMTYQTLYYEAPPPPPLKAYDEGQGRVITVGSLSKVLMPSLRFGWIWATTAQNNAFIRFKSDASSSRLAAEIVAEFMRNAPFEEQVARVRALYRRKHAIFVEALTEFAPDWLGWSVPNGGFFVWATLPQDVTLMNVLRLAHARGLDVFPGRASYVTPPHDRTMRLCFAMLEDDILHGAGRVLGEVLYAAGK